MVAVKLQRSNKAFCWSDMPVLDKNTEVVYVLRALLLSGLWFFTTKLYIGHFWGHLTFWGSQECSERQLWFAKCLRALCHIEYASGVWRWDAWARILECLTDIVNSQMSRKPYSEDSCSILDIFSCVWNYV